MYQYKINLETMSDIKEFVKAVTPCKESVKVTDNNEYTVNGKSVLGVIGSIEWDSVYCVSDEDIYSLIQKWVSNNTL